VLAICFTAARVWWSSQFCCVQQAGHNITEIDVCVHDFDTKMLWTFERLFTWYTSSVTD
jgi:hypothetical protein